jgi:hypothetical protein
MTDKRQTPEEIEAAAQRIVDLVFEGMREQDRVLSEALGPDFRARLLAGFDDFQRKRRTRLTLSSFAEAFGWKALGRPIAPAGILGALCAIGFVAGASANGAADADLSAALDRSFSYSAEAAW